jgi:phosphomannomutase
MEVIDVGLVTTPMLYFAASTLCTSGIQVTGSHNPKDYNGFKMVLARPRHLWRRNPGLRRTMESRKLATAARRQRAPGRCAAPTASASWAT